MARWTPATFKVGIVLASALLAVPMASCASKQVAGHQPFLVNLKAASPTSIAAFSGPTAQVVTDGVAVLKVQGTANVQLIGLGLGLAPTGAGGTVVWAGIQKLPGPEASALQASQGPGPGRVDPVLLSAFKSAGGSQLAHGVFYDLAITVALSRGYVKTWSLRTVFISYAVGNHRLRLTVPVDLEVAPASG